MADIEGELGAFIRSRRDALRPADLGLPAGSRRRVPGLRRSELATVAGISVDYLVRLEQGRDTNPSSQVLGALADALRLDDDERLHLKILAGMAHAANLCPSAPAAARTIRPTIARLLEQLEPSPALVLNHRSDLLAWTSGYEPVGRAIGLLEHPTPNLVRYTFGDERSRSAYPDWDQVADDQVANLRASIQGCSDTDDQFLDELRDIGGEGFRRRWDARPVATKRSGTKRVHHPHVGELRLDFETLTLPDAETQRLVVYLPADPATTSRLDELQGRRPGALRPVTDTRSA